jgi:acyl carrier protein
MAPKLSPKASAALLGQANSQASLKEVRQGQLRSEIDDVAGKYTAVADDAAASAKKREAAMLLSVAESQLVESGNADEALRGATEALEKFRAVDDLTGAADAIRMVVNAHKAKADAFYWEKDGDAKAAEELKLAEEMARAELAKFEEKGNSRGVGAMSLSIAETMYLKSPTDPMPGDYKKRAEALELATKAKEAAVTAEDKHLEGLACFSLFKLQADGLHAEKALDTAESAVKIFNGLGMKRKEAEALCDLAQARYMAAAIPEALKALKSATKILKETGPQKMVGGSLLMQGMLCLLTDRAKEAMPLAKEAMEIFEAAPAGMGYLPAAIAMVSRAYSQGGEAPKAKTVLEEGVKTCKEKEDKRGELLVKVALIDSSLGGDLYSDEGVEDALAAADDAIAVSRELGDKVWESQMLHNKLMLLVRGADNTAAKETAAEVDALLVDIGNASEQAKVLDTVALMEQQNEEFDAAAETRAKMRELYQKTGETIREAMTMLQTCVTYCAAPLSKDTLDKAMDAAKDAQNLCQEADYKSGEAISLGCQAEIYLAGETEKDMDADKALSLALEAQKIFQETGNKPSEAILMRTLANAYLNKKDTEEAVMAATNAVNLCKKAEERRLMADAQMLLAQTLLDAAAIQCDGAKDQVKILKKAGNKAMKAAKDALQTAKKVDDRTLIATATYTVALVNVTLGNGAEGLKGANLAVELFTELGSKSGGAGATALVAEAFYQMGENDKAVDVAQKAIALAQKCKDTVSENRASGLVDLIQGVPMGGDFLFGGGMDMMQMMAAAAASGAPAAVEKKGMDPEYVKGIVNTVALGSLATDEEIHLDSPLMESGMDSLSSVAFRNALNQQLGMNLPAALMFDYPSQRSIIDHVVEQSKA